MKAKHQRVLIGGGLVALCAATFVAGRAWAGGAPATPPVMTYAGVLEGADGKPLTGNQIVEIKLWPSATPGKTELCGTSAKTVTPDAHGRFSLALDACVDIIKANPDAWLEVLLETNGDTSSLGITKIGAVPYALEAGHATSADAAAAADGALAQQIVPSGAVMAFNKAQCPAGWTTYMPAAGRVVVGTSASVALGATVGADQVTLTTQQMPSHNHALHDPGHVHGAQGAGFVVDHYPSHSTGYPLSGGYPDESVYGDATTDQAKTNIYLDDAGGDKPFDNRQASVGLLYCQKM